MLQLTEEGIEDDWQIAVTFYEAQPETFLKSSLNFIKVTNEKLYLIDYASLTMAAQFEHEKMPNKECQALCFDIKNGIYQ